MFSFQTAGGPTDRSVGGADRQQHHDMERCDFRAARHPLRGRHVQADDRVHGGVPEQTAHRPLRVQDVPPERVRGRRHLPGHPAEPVESHVRRVGHPDLHTVTAQRSQPQLARQLHGRPAVQREPPRVREAGQGVRRAELHRLAHGQLDWMQGEDSFDFYCTAYCV